MHTFSLPDAPSAPVTAALIGDQRVPAGAGPAILTSAASIPEEGNVEDMSEDHSARMSQTIGGYADRLAAEIMRSSLQSLCASSSARQVVPGRAVGKLTG